MASKLFRALDKRARRKKLIRECDALFREYIYIRDKKTCQRCGSTTAPNCAHFYSRSIKVLRWDYRNSCVLCAGCHIHFAHEQPAEFSEWYKKYVGEVAFNILQMSKNNQFSTSESNLQIMKLVLQTDLEKIKNALA